MREMSPDFRVQGLGGRLWGLGYSSTYLRMCAHVCAHTHSLSLSLSLSDCVYCILCFETVSKKIQGRSTSEQAQAWFSVVA